MNRASGGRFLCAPGRRRPPRCRGPCGSRDPPAARPGRSARSLRNFVHFEAVNGFSRTRRQLIALFQGGLAALICSKPLHCLEVHKKRRPPAARRRPPRCRVPRRDRRCRSRNCPPWAQIGNQCGLSAERLRAVDVPARGACAVRERVRRSARCGPQHLIPLGTRRVLRVRPSCCRNP